MVWHLPSILTVLALVFAIASYKSPRLIFGSFALVVLDVIIDKYRWHGGWH